MRNSMKPSVTISRKMRVETAQKMKVCSGSLGPWPPKSNEPCQITRVAEIISTTSAEPYRRRFFMVGRSPLIIQAGGRDLRDVPRLDATIVLPPRLKELASMRAHAAGISFGEFVRRAVKQAVAEPVTRRGRRRDSSLTIGPFSAVKVPEIFPAAMTITSMERSDVFCGHWSFPGSVFEPGCVSPQGHRRLEESGCRSAH